MRMLSMRLRMMMVGWLHRPLPRLRLLTSMVLKTKRRRMKMMKSETSMTRVMKMIMCSLRRKMLQKKKVLSVAEGMTSPSLMTLITRRRGCGCWDTMRARRCLAPRCSMMWWPSMPRQLSQSSLITTWVVCHRPPSTHASTHQSWKEC